MSDAEKQALHSKVAVSCPVCESRSFRVKYEPWVEVVDPVALYGAASSIQGTQTLVVCSDCQTLYENPRYPEEVIYSGYASADESQYDSQHEIRVSSFYKALRSMRQHLPGAGAKVLDIGTGGGAFIEAAARVGYVAKGLEPSEFLVSQCLKRGLDVALGSVDNFQLPERSYDMVCMWDVLEHIPRPKDALRQLRPLLKQDGVLLINYPDIGTWQAKLAGKRFWWILSGHLLHFSRNSIREICRSSGFDVYRLKPYWQSLQVGYLMKLAIHYGLPLSSVLERLTPEFLKRLPLPYYASQTTALARLRPE